MVAKELKEQKCREVQELKGCFPAWKHLNLSRVWH